MASEGRHAAFRGSSVPEGQEAASPSLDPAAQTFLVEQGPALIWRAAPDGRRDYVNATWQRFTGKSIADELGQGWIEDVHPEDRAKCLESHRSHFERRVPFEIEFRLRRHDGAYRWMLEKGVPIRATDEFHGYLGVCVDIHDHDHERRGRRVAGETFLRMMSHELRTPLQAVKMFVEILRRGAAAGEVAAPAAFDRLDAQFDRFNRLIDDLSQSAQGGELSLELAPLDLGELLRRIVQSRIGPLRDEPGRVRHRLEFDGPERAETRGDARRLEKALRHVIDNALKFSPRGGPVGVTLRSAGGVHRITVRDEGVGIPDAEIPLVGRRFFRGSNVPRRNFPGMGLGLALAREIVEKHGGTLSLESGAARRGTEVTILLPRSGGGP